MTELTDDDVAAARTGDQSALRRLYETLAPPVLGYLRAKGVTDPEAVTNDVFVALLPQLPRLRGGAPGLRKLAFSIAHARMVDDHRRRLRGQPSMTYEASLDPRTAPSAEDDAEYDLATERVLSVLRHLPEDQREVLILRVIADLSIDQIADIMGRSSGAVKQLQRRGMIAVRTLVADWQVTR